MTRGDVWLAQLDPVRGSEQAGTRPVLVFQAEPLNKLSSYNRRHPVYNESKVGPVSIRDFGLGWRWRPEQRFRCSVPPNPSQR